MSHADEKPREKRDTTENPVQADPEAESITELPDRDVMSVIDIRPWPWQPVVPTEPLVPTSE